jgi:hypothetical protein
MYYMLHASLVPIMSILRKMNFESSETTLQLKSACVGPQSAYKVIHIVVRRGVKYGKFALQEVPFHHPPFARCKEESLLTSLVYHTI